MAQLLWTPKNHRIGDITIIRVGDRYHLFTEQSPMDWDGAMGDAFSLPGAASGLSPVVILRHIQRDRSRALTEPRGIVLSPLAQNRDRGYPGCALPQKDVARMGAPS